MNANRKKEWRRRRQRWKRCSAMQRKQEGRKPPDVSVALIRKKHEVIGFTKVERVVDAVEKKPSEKSRVTSWKRGTMSCINKKHSSPLRASTESYETKENLPALYRIIITFRRSLRTEYRYLSKEEREREREKGSRQAR